MAVQNQSAAFDVSAATTTAVVAAVEGKKISVLNYGLYNGVATGNSVQFKSGSTNLTGVIQLPLAVGGHNLTSGSGDVALFTTAAGAALNITTTAATQVGGHVAFKYV